jgi:menaquinone-dependent protoporphyrinogen oxidase
MANLLLIYSTTDGHTVTICDRLRQVVEAAGHAVKVVAVEDAGSADVEACDAVVIGASIRYGKHSQAVTEFIARNAAPLASRPNAFFSVNIVARKPNKNQPDTNPYLQKFLRRIAWKPQHLAVFAGKLDYPRYGFFDRTMIRFIMLMTKGPTDPTTVVEFTDWQQVEAFGRRMATLVPPAV